MPRDWEAYWEHLWEIGDFDKLGPKGQDYIIDKYGETYEGTEPPYDVYEDFQEWDFDIEY